MLRCGSCWVSDSSVCQEIIQGSLPTHKRPRCRRLKGLGQLDQLFLRRVVSRLFRSCENSSEPALLYTVDKPLLNGYVRAINQQLENVWIRRVKTVEELSQSAHPQSRTPHYEPPRSPDRSSPQRLEKDAGRRDRSNQHLRPKPSSQ